ncbi:PPOX class F420-dependent oxidoreductase [Actinophytocola sediminis]
MSVEVLRKSSIALLTTYRRDGSGVGTPVNVKIKDGKAYFMTRATSAKVKRLANNPEVSLAPSTSTGKPTGPAVRGRARRLDGTDGTRTRFWIFARLVYRDRPIAYEITLTQS